MFQQRRDARDLGLGALGGQTEAAEGDPLPTGTPIRPCDPYRGAVVFSMSAGSLRAHLGGLRGMRGALTRVPWKRNPSSRSLCRTTEAPPDGPTFWGHPSPAPGAGGR